jgi:hypothetical protein
MGAIMSDFRASLAVLTLAFAGCGVENEPQGQDAEGQWQDAEGAQEFFAHSASQAALKESTVESLSISCEALLPAAQAALEEPGSAGLRVLIQACSQERLGFGEDLRCKDGTLQVRCL